MGTRDFGSWRHLVARFFGAVLPGGPRPGDEAWAREHLLPGEWGLWVRMSGPDRRHAVGVARQAIALLGDDRPARPVVAAALLHDVGKVEAGLGTLARVVVTVAAMVLGRERLAAGGAGYRGRVAAYLTHDRIGGRLLRAAGADPLTASWAEEHHLPSARWSVEARIGEVLKAADGD